MSFLQTEQNKTLRQKNNKFSTNPTSLTLLKNDIGNYTPKNFPIPLIYELYIKLFVRRMSLPPLLNLKASMTVEAACALPLFIFFVLNLLSVIEMLRFHGNMAYALRTAGNQLALYGYAYENLTGDTMDILGTMAGKTVFSYLYVREEIEKILGKEYLENAPLQGQKAGLVFAEAKFMEEEDVSLVITYRMEMPFSITESLSVRMYNCFYARAWTGYVVAKENTKACVYVAQNGTVYHLDRQCSHLCLSVRQADKKQIVSLRNENGSRYLPCERCGENNGSRLYITDDGSRYHGSLECPGLKRTVYTLEWEQAQKYKPCSRCGGG